MKTYNQFNESQKMTALHQPTDIEVKDAEEYLEKGIDPNWDFKLGYFYIDVSGKYSVYYTLWKESLHNTHFITNLSTDFMTAVEKAKKAAGRIPVIIDRLGTKSGLFQAAKAEILTFGKYRGKTLGDIFVEDPKYIVWLSKNYDGKSKDRSDKIEYYKKLYFETVTKKNLEESPSKYIGNIGDKISIEADVYGDKKVQSLYNNKLQMTCKLVDKDGNKYMTYDLGKDVKDGDSVKLTAKVKDHKEFLGVKFTQIYYCKVSNVWNLVEDQEKYNL